MTESSAPPRWARGSGFSLTVLMAMATFLVVGRVVEISTGPLPAAPGQTAPALVGQGLQEEIVDLARLRGRVVLVDFWATWCPPCVEMMPSLQRLHQEFGAKGFTVLGVNQEPTERDHVRSFLQRRALSFPQVFDEGRIAPSFGVHSFPTSFLVGRDGKIVAAHRGATSEAKLRREIEAALTSTSSTSLP